MSDWRRTYFDRVRPAVGELLQTRSLAVWRVERCALPAEALARSGLRHQVWFSSAPSSAAMRRSFGESLRGGAAGDALAAHCAAHNTFETDWQLDRRPAETAQLARLLRREPPALLLAALDEQAGEVCRLALDAAVPLVMVHVPAGGVLGAVALVWTPGSNADPAALVRLCRQLATLPRRDLDREENQIDGLEASSLALSLCRFLLAPQRPPRPDLVGPLLEQGRSVILRGQPAWPWAVRLVAPGDAGIVEIAADPRPPYRPPASLLHGERLMVLGLGTASLFVGEAPLLARQLLLVDAGEVSPFNPVRPPSRDR
jgi:hypothetical protein